MILITGGSGFVGSALAQAFTDDCITVGRTSVPDRSNHIAVDLLSPDALQQIQSSLRGAVIDSVIHAAAVTPWSESSSYHDDLVMADVVGAFCKLNNVPKLLYLSGWVVYAPDAAVPYTENSPLGPVSDYGKSKLAVENRLVSLVDSGTLTSIRAASIYGPGQRSPGLISNLCLSARTGVMAPQSVLTKRDYIYIDDFVAAMQKLQETTDLPPALNVGSGASVSVLDVAKVIQQAYTSHYHQAVTINEPKSPIESTPIDNQLDISLAQSLGIIAGGVSFDTGITKYIEWAKDEHIL